MTESITPEAVIPLVEERLTVDKHVVETGRVRIHTVIDEKLMRVAEDLERDDVTVERVAVNREVTEPPQSREENGVLIVPILEEIVVIEKRLLLKEELHIRRNRSREHVEQAVSVKAMRPEVQRVAPATPAGAARSAQRDSAEPVPRLRRKQRMPNPLK
jgi:uncharacterized protein (TIGR02271 family)